MIHEDHCGAHVSPAAVVLAAARKLTAGHMVNAKVTRMSLVGAVLLYRGGGGGVCVFDSSL